MRRGVRVKFSRRVVILTELVQLKVLGIVGEVMILFLIHDRLKHPDGCIAVAREEWL